jgi:type II secretion system protein N
MTRPGLVRGAVFTVAWLALFIVCIYIVFPSSRINAVIDRELSAQGLSLSPGAHKTLVPGLAWDKTLLSSEQGALMRVDRMTIRPLLTRLPAGRFVLGWGATIGSGRIGLEYLVSGTQAVTFSSDGIELSDVPLFKTVLGATRVGGRLQSDGSATRGPHGWSGELRIDISRLEFSGVRMGAFALPDAASLHSRGMVRLTDGKARLESFTLEGEGLYMRLSGEVPTGGAALSAPLNLVLEIMPKPDFLENQKLVFMMLAKFMVSPGVYRVPIAGTLLKPQIL